MIIYEKLKMEVRIFDNTSIIYYLRDRKRFKEAF